mmetsp:Transcript_14825/g.28238  ORF Transcript_14825/g.28238 Transcript_14825/m.28238 type:complete len:233 (+) Transcript_14825:232-930(+)
MPSYSLVSAQLLFKGSPSLTVFGKLQNSLQLFRLGIVDDCCRVGVFRLDFAQGLDHVGAKFSGNRRSSFGQGDGGQFIKNFVYVRQHERDCHHDRKGTHTIEQPTKNKHERALFGCRVGRGRRRRDGRGWVELRSLMLLKGIVVTKRIVCRRVGRRRWWCRRRSMRMTVRRRPLTIRPHASQQRRANPSQCPERQQSGCDTFRQAQIINFKQFNAFGGLEFEFSLLHRGTVC